VHHSHYAIWFEIGRTELLREMGATYGQLEDEQALLFPVIELGLRYRAPARYDELIEVRTGIEELAGVRLRFAYRIVRPSESLTLVEGFSVHAATTPGGRPRRVPGDLKRRIEDWMQGDSTP
jgi:acyl-CoA thioester hydrolase